MQAIQVTGFGGPEVLQLREVPDPTAGAGEVLVRLRAAGVNPVDVYRRSGAYANVPTPPYIPGSDGAGEVVAVGTDVQGRQPGDRVYVAGAPSYAQFVAAPAAAVWPLPPALTFSQGAAIGVPYRTAYLALHLVARAQPGERVLVRGGTGGVGIAAIQLAACHGCDVVATSGTETGRVLVEGEGARASCGHGDVPRLAELADGHGYDVIIEMLANVNLGSDLTLLAPRGRVAVVGSRGEITIDPRDIMSRSAAVLGVMGMTPEERRRIHLGLDACLRNGVLQPVVGATFPLLQAAASHRTVMSPGAHGKVVLEIP